MSLLLLSVAHILAIHHKCNNRCSVRTHSPGLACASAHATHDAAAGTWLTECDRYYDDPEWE